jgi:hypothetical protein
MRYLLIIFLFLSQLANGQIINASQPYRPMVSANLLLDDYPGAAAAYSLRKLDKDYTGSAIRVRRSSDNTEQDIGFTGNDLDTVALKNFVGANNGFVVTWYNQADSAGVFGVRNMTQSVSSQQPRIINGGVIERENSKVCVFYDGSNDFLRAAVSQTNFAASTIYGYYVGRLNDAAGTNIWLGYRVGANGRLYHGVEFMGISATVRNYTVNKINQYGLHDYDYSLYDAFYNATQQIGTATPSGSSNTDWLLMGAYDGNSDIQTAIPDTYVLSYISEWIIYPNSTNKTAIRTNINNYYGIY